MKKAFSNIKPFNDVTYYNCKYNNLITAFKYFGGDIREYLTNDFFYYEFSDRLFNVLRLAIKSDDEIFEENNIKFIHNKYSNALEDVKNAINNDNMVLITINRFGWKEFTYNETHRVHFIVAYGYDDDKKLLYVIDTEENICYKRTIKYSDFEYMYEATKHLNSIWRNVSIEISLNKTTDKSYNYSNKDYFNLYKNNFLLTYEHIKNSIDNVNVFKDKISKNSDTLLDLNYDEINSTFYLIENAYRVELYKLKIFLGNHDNIIELKEEAFKNISNLKNILYKISMKKYVEQRNVDNILNLLSNIVNIETNIINNIYDIVL